MTRKRSSYKPKPVLLDNLSFVVSGLKPIDSHRSAALDLRMKNHSALLEVQQGRGTKAHVDVLIGAMNVTEALIRTAKLGNDWSPEVRAAQDALFAMAQRGAISGRFLFTGPELTAMNLAMELHDEQLNHCTVGQMERAVNYVHQMMRSGVPRKIINHETPTTPPATKADTATGDGSRQAHSHRDPHREDHGGAQSRPIHRRIAAPKPRCTEAR